jgi:hypothetical protein
MKEIVYVVAVVLLAMVIASSTNEMNEIHKRIHETLSDIERMKANPSPQYEHYPNPQRSDYPGELED